ncbi:helix-turn-helix domain-containing protein [Kineococcus rubinsiae]|uniref:helix-turn-helix domain-containing protein n=1 Tax=Kineococcus rubinsiae TaxID=2609562 RepID=UPI001430C93A|nr:helix-turn-helix transcriptional regulator [Kineococcus rubinsiae]NIZ91972.1 helix-turn-helix transcriptional regulator [Kineococcus rubinsiae]
MTARPVPARPAAVALDVSQPPEVVNQGRGTHGVLRSEDVFQLPQLWSLHLYGYAADLEVDGTPHAITPGCVTLVPPASLIRYRYHGPSQHLYAHLRAPRLPAADSRAAASRLSVLMHPGADLPRITELMESAVASAVARPERTRADVWTVLLRLADRVEAAPADPAGRPDRVPDVHRVPDYVAATVSVIERRLAEPLTVRDVAAAVGVSPGHLTRVFSARTGETVVGYLRRRRVEHARHLLTSSTMSISAVAASVGIPDLQAFNKTCRAVTGSSPRGLRAGV